MSQQPADDFAKGFWFGVKLAESLHQPLPLNCHLAQLEAVASGELSLLPSDVEYRAAIEARAGVKIPACQRAVIRLPNRAGQNAGHQKFARRILGR
jgi:hypothetical protein